MSLFHREEAPPDAASPFKLYHYDPTIAGGVIFVLLFLATTVLHSWQLFRKRGWIAIPLVIGGLLQIIGYAARCKSGNESPNWALGPYIIQAIFLLVAPALYAATIYMQLGRIITMTDGESHALISRKWMTKIFVTGDVLSFFLQGGGGGYQASGTLEALQSGTKVIIAGLFVQLIFFGIFIIIAIRFDMSIRAIPTSRSHIVPWKKHMMALYIGSVFIMVRSIFRAAEYLQGFDGYLLKHEAYLYVFDALLMFLTMALFNWIHPGEVTLILKDGEPSRTWKMNTFSESHQRLGSVA